VISARLRYAYKRETGFALLIVLWTLALASFVVAQMASAARTEARVAYNLRSNVIQESQADGAVYAAAFRLLDLSERHLEPDGARHPIPVHGGTASVRITDESSKVNLNTASVDLLRALLLVAGAEPGAASSMANAIIAWRGDQAPDAGAGTASQYGAAGMTYAPPGKPFRSLDELSFVLGMTPDLVSRIKPHLTLWSTYGPNRDSTDPVAASAIMMLRTKGGVLPFERDSSGERVVQIVATVTGSGGGAAFTRRAILRIDPAAKGLPCAILAWEKG
jgi:general secretion pathway protein K